METFLIATAGLVALIVSYTLPVKFRFSIALVLSVLQLYTFPIGDFYVSMAFAASLSLWPEALKEAKVLFSKKIFTVAIILLLTHIISILWSPDPRMGLRTIVYMLPFFFIACASFSIAKKDSGFIYKTLYATCLLMSIQAALVIIFRVSPTLELSYLSSNLAGLFSGPNVIENLMNGAEANNVFDPDKAGGFFVNGNTASTYLGMGSFTAYMMSRVKKSRLLLLTTVTLWLAVFFTGSKSGAMLALGLPAIAIIQSKYFQFNNQSKSAILKISILLLPLIVFAATQLIGLFAVDSTFATNSMDTASTRFEIWNYAASAFLNSPIFGQGFGGWQIGYGAYAASIGIPASFPPHNTLIYLWSQSGLLAAILGIAFIYYVMRLSYQLMKCKDQESKLLGTALGLVSGWLFIHGMGENIGLFGEQHQQPLLATLIGLAYASRIKAINSGFAQDSAAIRRKY